MSEQAPPELITTEVVALGLREMGDNKLGNCLMTKELLEELLAMGDETFKYEVYHQASIFTTDKKEKYIVGGLYDCNVRLEGKRIRTFGPSSMKFKELYGNDAVVMQLRASNDIAVARKRAKDIEAKLGRTKPFDEAIQDIRAAYWKTPPQDRFAFQLMLLDAVTKNRPKA